MPIPRSCRLRAGHQFHIYSMMHYIYIYIYIYIHIYNTLGYMLIIYVSGQQTLTAARSYQLRSQKMRTVMLQELDAQVSVLMKKRAKLQRSLDTDEQDPAVSWNQWIEIQFNYLGYLVLARTKKSSAWWRKPLTQWLIMMRKWSPSLVKNEKGPVRVLAISRMVSWNGLALPILMEHGGCPNHLQIYHMIYLNSYIYR